VAAMAADLPLKAPAPAPVAPFSWAGPYLGVRGGYGWGTADYVNLGGSAAGGTFGGISVPLSNTFGAIGSTASHDVNGGVLGYVSGINWQTGQYVYGLEQTLSWARIRGNSGSFNFSVPPAVFVPTGIFDSELQWYGTAESRFGMMFGNSLLYVKGGLAAGRVNVSGLRTNGTSLGDNFDVKTYRVGWTVGAGWDYAVTNNWVFGIEGDYVDLGKVTAAGQSISATGALGAGAFNEETKFKFWNVLGRLTYKWNSGLLGF
jgi:outer membrane immunogenic protein